MSTDASHPCRTARSRRALLVALGVDNLGSGLFLPSVWMPWVAVGIAAAVGAVAMPLVAHRLPPGAGRPG